MNNLYFFDPSLPLGSSLAHFVGESQGETSGDLVDGYPTASRKSGSVTYRYPQSTRWKRLRWYPW